MDRNELHELLSSRTKKVEQTSGLGGVLARLWRSILSDLNVEAGRMDHCLTQFIDNARRNSTDPSLAGNFNRGNLRRELARDTMTIKVFMKALRVLNVRKVRFIVQLTHAHGEPTNHQVVIDIQDDALFAEEANKDPDK